MVSTNNKRKALALLTAVVTLAGGLTAGTAYAGGEAGNRPGTGGSGAATQFWQYKDDASGSWGPATDINSVSSAMANAGVRMDDSAGKAAAALKDANDRCVDGFHQRHPGEGDGDCRVVAVGAVSGNGTTTSVWNGSGIYDQSVWKDNWNKYIAPGDYNYAGTRHYKTSTAFDDDPSTSVDKLMERYVSSTASIVIIALDKYQPAPPNYTLSVSTTHGQRTDLKVGSTDPISDILHASNNGSSIKESLNGTAIIHYEGQKNGYVAAKTVSKPITFANNGDTRLDNLATPADFGMNHWQEGQYWIDIQIAKQGRMNAAVDTADKDPAETWSVSAEPPSPPVKTIDEGVSADGMTNRTVITYGTGKGGYEMAFKDEITADGVDCTVDNYRLVDKSDNDRDVSGEFQIGWDKAANTVTAVRTADKGEMPLDHEIEFSFDVTVSKPKDFRKVKDHATGKWNQEPEADAGSKEFDTWQPNPDKSWIFEQNGRWQAVIDPQETNKTGGDSHTYLDGSRLGSVVNGTIGKNLIQAPKKLVLTDDWTAADYIFDADTKNIRVYEAEAGTDRESSVSDIVNTGKDVTDQFDITVQGTKATAAAKTSYLKGLKGLKNPKQVTLLIPGKINFADGKGAEQVRKDYGKAAGDELTFCAAPTGKNLTNSGSETVNNHTEPTNEPQICGYIPPVKKDVVSEASQGGDQESVDGKVVQLGQKVEYQLNTQPQLPADLAYEVKSVSFTDSYDAYLKPDKQTLEMMDLNTGKPVSKKKYTTTWDDSKHMFTLTVTDQETISQWRAGTSPRLQVRFEGTVADDAPTDHKVGNKWVLTLNNSITPSNEVFNIPPKLDPVKKDTQKDPTISIDGKTALLGDEIYYRVDIDARQDNQAYKVWRLGMTDDYDDEYLKLDATNVEITDETGKDVTSKFNIQDKDGVLYAYAKLVDTQIPATGETVPGDPQPGDLKAYSEKTDKDYDPLKDPSIDQSLLGHTYQVVMPMTVTKVKDGHTVENTATQVTNDKRDKTNTVTNPLKEINPTKDVTVQVGGDSIDGKSVYLNHTFLYRLDSSILPPDRAYQTVTDWGGTDQLNTEYDQYLGNWAVYASRDLYRDGQILAAKGEKIAGSGFDSSKFGGNLFTVDADDNGKVTADATQAYLDLVSADNEHEAGWVLYLQCKRIAVADEVPNTWTETINGQPRESNKVVTKTPDMTPSIHLEKVDTPTLKQDGQEQADRDDPKQALKMDADSIGITFIITNTSKTDPATGDGAWFKASDLNLDDSTIVGDAHVDMDSLTYPADWDTLVLKPGESVSVTGTLKGVKEGETHTDRAIVTGTPLVECAPSNGDPFNDKTDGGEDTDPEYSTGDVTEIDGKQLCADTQTASNTDDWNGYRAKPLASTGTAVLGLAGGALAVLLAGGSLLVFRKRHYAQGSGRHTAVNAGK